MPLERLSMALKITYHSDDDIPARSGKLEEKLDNLPEKQLWKLFKNGSEDAYAFIYRKYFPVLYNYGRQFCNSEDGVKDCIQDLFVEIWDRKENLADTDSIKFYLFKALKREIIHKQPQRQAIGIENKVFEKGVFEMVLPLENHLIAQQEEKEKVQRVREAVNGLSDKQREVIFLLFYENMSHRQIADILSVETKTIRNLLWKAMVALRKIVKSPLLAFLLFWSQA